MTDVLLKIDGISKEFSTVPVLKHIDLEVMRAKCSASSAKTAPASPP